MEIFTKKELLKQLSDMKDLAKKCPHDMLFHAQFEFTALDQRFMNLAKDFNIKKGLEEKRKQESKGNI